MAFEFDGEKYSRASSHQKEWGLKLITEFDFTGNERVLDLGCGDGFLTAQIADLVPDGYVIGIDASYGMIKSALKHRRGNLEFKQMDINNLAFENEFDLIFSNAALHWIKNHDALLSNVLNHLKTDGIIRFNFAAEGNCSNFYRVVKQVMQQPEFAVYFENFAWPWFFPNVNEYKDFIGGFNFKEFKVWSENADIYFANSKAMIGWIEQPSIVPFLKHVDSRDKKKFRDTVVKQMIQTTQQDDGTCFETFRRINVFAKK